MFNFGLSLKSVKALEPVKATSFLRIQAISFDPVILAAAQMAA